MSETLLQMAIRQRNELREEWAKEGCPKGFYEWLLDRVEKSTERERA